MGRGGAPLAGLAARTPPGQGRPGLDNRDRTSYIVYNMVLNLKTVDRASTYDVVLDALRQAIVSGRLAAGARLVQEELAQQLGVSRIPLREALRTLEAEDLVRFERNRGAIVTHLTSAGVSNLYRVRVALEEVAAEQAARAKVRNLAAPFRADGEAAAKRGDLPALIRLDRAFHQSIGKASGNEYVERWQAQCWSQIERVMHEYLRFEHFPQHVWAEHHEIGLAIEQGKGAQARRLLRQHLAASLSAVIGRLEKE
ncbi:GntR family transcriptional regulator [bacterium]|nr:MAG: GntR family transcriptional regulator [bacterium]